MRRVDLFLLDPASLDAHGAAWLPSLDEAERTRHTRFRHPADRAAFVAAHGLLRRALTARMPSTEPSQWRFTSTASGKPGLTGSRLRFNLSHCRELVAVAITDELELGVDVEPVDPRHATADVARRVYGPAELADLAAQPDEAARVERFFERWTVKEAWVKATGVGIDDDLPAFEVRLGDGLAVVERGDARPWQFRWWTPKPGLKLALCVGTSEPLEVTPRWFSPGD